MIAREIPAEEWSRSLDSFSRDHVGWSATLEVMGDDIGDQMEADALPLAGVSADAERRTVWVALAKSADDHITHSIDHVSHLRIVDGESEPAIQIEAADGAKTLLRLTRTQ
jgi:hypothetical protein